MLGKDLSEALGDISDEMVEAAAGTGEGKKRGSVLWLRIAAAVATLAILLTAALWPRKTEDGYITAPGVLKVYAYDTTSGATIDDMVSYELKEGVVSHPYEWTPVMNSLYGLPLTFNVEDISLQGTEVSFDVEVGHGNFYGDIHNDKYKKQESDSAATLSSAYLGNQFTIDNGETIFWSAVDLYIEAMESGKEIQTLLDECGNVIYVDIIIRADDHIVGYAVMQITHEEGWYSASVCETVFYPRVDGVFQVVEEATIRQDMQKNR